MSDSEENGARSAGQVLLVIVGMIVVLAVLNAVLDRSTPQADNARNPSRSSSPTNDQDATGNWKTDPYYQCVQKGVAYFREIDSFPFLSDGRKSINVAEERCQRSFKAFPGTPVEDLGRTSPVSAGGPVVLNEAEETIRCTQRGIDHYMERKSFPRLADGHRAMDLISLTCQSSPYGY